MSIVLKLWLRNTESVKRLQRAKWLGKDFFIQNNLQQQTRISYSYHYVTKELQFTYTKCNAKKQRKEKYDVNVYSSQKTTHQTESHYYRPLCDP